MDFKQIIIAPNSGTFELGEQREKDVFVVRDEKVLQNPQLFPKGHIQFTRRNPSFIEETGEWLVRVTDRNNNILCFFSVDIGNDSSDFFPLSRSFPFYCVLVHKLTRYLNMPSFNIKLDRGYRH